MEVSTVSRSLSPATPDEMATQPVEMANEGVISEKAGLIPGNSLSSTDGTSVITAAILPPSEELRPADANNSLISDSSGGDPITENSLITKEMIEEEKMMHNENAEDEQEMLRQHQQSMECYTAADRHKRLKCLLAKSQLYSSYLAKRMQQQADEEHKRKERMEKKAAREAEKEKQQQEQENQPLNGQANKKVEQKSKGRRGLRNAASRDNSQESQADSQGSQGKRKRGNKRRADADSDEGNGPKIEDFFTNSKRKRQKKNETEDEPSEVPSSPVKAVPAIPNKQCDENILEGQPKLFDGGALRKYQLDGFLWLKGLYENGINGILADEMGLGKTIQCIALVAHLVEQNICGPFLVCGPLSTVPNWVAEFERFAPQVPVILYHGNKDDRAKLRTKLNPRYAKKHGALLPVLITSYDIVMNDRNHLMDKDWKLLIVDEGHRIKNFQCKLISDLKMYKSTHRLLLTGTPLQNNLSELWSLLNFLLPEIFDDLGSFEAWFDVKALSSSSTHEEIVKAEEKNNILSTIHQILMPFMLRRLKADVALAIPPKREVLVYAPLTQKQQEMYKAIVNKTIRGLLGVEEDHTETADLDSKGRPIRRSRQSFNYQEFLDAEDTDDKKPEDDDLDDWMETVSKQQQARRERFNASSCNSHSQEPQGALIKIQMRNTMALLRKSCNHPYLIEYPLTPGGDFKIDSGLINASGKFLILDKMLPNLKKNGNKVLIFSQMTSILDILYDYCYLKGWKSCRLDGSMGLTDRAEQMENFNTDPEVFIFLLSTRAGGLGINLTAADTCIIFDSDWNPQCDLQAQDRCHRIGQTRPVMVYRLVTANTIDQKIVERAAAKRKLEKMVIHRGQFKTGINEGNNVYKPITPEELLRLLKEMEYDKVMKEQSVISDEDLARLLDRSDLERLWAQRKAAEDAENGGESGTSKPRSESSSSQEPLEVQGVFKIIDEELGHQNNILPSVNNAEALNIDEGESKIVDDSANNTLNHPDQPSSTEIS